MGSSPRVRGTHVSTVSNVRVTGIIPACAGNTWEQVMTIIDARDHPRVCGEHIAVVILVSFLLGSSPRVRGTRVDLVRKRPRAGIIPACAGNTKIGYHSALRCRDHPRVCGEHVVERRSRRGFKGSSPRVRGTLPPRYPTMICRGIIPACAGNTRYGIREYLKHGDHPRVCGEHPRQRYYTTTQPGSSPRVRGTLLRNKAPILEEGIIPACAGNTRAAGSRRC